VRLINTKFQGYFYFILAGIISVLVFFSFLVPRIERLNQKQVLQKKYQVLIADHRKAEREALATGKKSEKKLFYFSQETFNEFLMIGLGSFAKRSGLELGYVKPVTRRKKLANTGFALRSLTLSLQGSHEELVSFLGLLADSNRLIKIRKLGYSVTRYGASDDAVILLELDVYVKGAGSVRSLSGARQ
jgi:hypothetical protein